MACESQGQEVESNRAVCALTAGGRLVAATPTQGGSIRCGVFWLGHPGPKRPARGRSIAEGESNDDDGDGDGAGGGPETQLERAPRPA